MKKIVTLLSLLIGFVYAQTIVVGGKNFTEQKFLAEMTTQLLEAKGFKVDLKNGMGTTVLRKAQEHGQIDVYWEYTGTSLITFNKVKEKLQADEVYKRVKELDKKIGLVWLEPSKANNTYALAMRISDKDKFNITTISDFAKAVNNKEKIKVGLNAEFSARADGMPAVEKAYKFKVKRSNKVKMDSGIIYTALKNKNIDLGLVFATDGRISAYDFYTLEDDLGFFPNYAIVPVIREEVLAKNPKLGEILNSASRVLTDTIMRNINKSIDVDKKTVKEVSKSFLKEHGLI